MFKEQIKFFHCAYSKHNTKKTLLRKTGFYHVIYCVKEVLVCTFKMCICVCVGGCVYVSITKHP